MGRDVIGRCPRGWCILAILCTHLIGFHQGSSRHQYVVVNGGLAEQYNFIENVVEDCQVS